MLAKKSDFHDIGDYRFKGIDRSVKLYQTQMSPISDLDALDDN
jgi:adenylate cyclase